MAAFLPQIFGRMNQYTKELKLGWHFQFELTWGQFAVADHQGKYGLSRGAGKSGKSSYPMRNSPKSPRNSALKSSRKKIMAIINQATKELQVKIVYYGPGKGGKTTNLEQIHGNVQNVQEKGKLVSLATSSDRRCSSISCRSKRWRSKDSKPSSNSTPSRPGDLQHHPATGVARRGRDRVSWRIRNTTRWRRTWKASPTWRRISKTLKINLGDIPYVLQYNKRDLPNAAPVEYMDFLLNNRDVQVPSFAASGDKCEGVFDTLNMITRMLLNKFIHEGNRKVA